MLRTHLLLFWLGGGLLVNWSAIGTAVAADPQDGKAALKAVIVTGHDGPFHDWRATSAALEQVLSRPPGLQVKVETTPEFLASPELAGYSLVVLNYCNWQRPGLSDAARAGFLKYLEAGHGLAIVHFTNGAFHAALPGAKEGDWPEFRKICRRWWTWGKSAHDDFGPFRIELVEDRPLLEGMSSFDTEDELYFGQEGTEPIRVLATARSKKTGRDEPMAFIYTYGKARVFQTTLGHAAGSILNPGAAELIRRGCRWAAEGPEEKTAAAGPGAPLEPWTHKGLTVTTGIIAWYDGTAENGARLARQEPQMLYGRPVDVWHDGSGGRHDLIQPSASERPSMRYDVQTGSVRFEGRPASLSARGLNRTLGDFTLFLVATSLASQNEPCPFLALDADRETTAPPGLSLGPGASSSRFAALRVRGSAFNGDRGIPFEPGDLGRLRRFCVASTRGPAGTTLYADGKPIDRRDRGAQPIRVDRLTVGAGARGGSLAGEIAEVILYDRLLTEVERGQVEQYLQARYDRLRPAPLPRPEAATRPVPLVANPPPVQMFAPGFSVRRLPVDLTNVNNVRYRQDGKLVALTYDGRILLLTDTDRDGLEDRVDVFWDQPGIVGPIGMALTPSGDPRGKGVFLACWGRVLLVLDADGDDRGDRLVVVAEGWKPIKHGVDALGIALGPDGSVYFGLGAEGFANAYVINPLDRQSHYDLNSERGSILRVSPDFKRRERIASGIRFSVALAFNRQGDLFCTDQEGATWLANGNPFDELLQIQPGRHYGFPPRHPRHLPGVIDEPSVYDYTPQHQSACGLCFNELAPGGQQFGPAWWEGNALVTGYSRGKLYRTTLVKTALGYVADNAIIGSLNMLPPDLCVSPRGELVVAAHTGGPDWGSGPAGKGALFQIAYTNDAAPQPVRAWAASPYEVRIAFDRPLDPGQVRERARQVLIEYGPYVRPGDRFEQFHPGYAIVVQQRETPRALLPVASTSITADRRTLILNTAAHERAVHYAVIMPQEPIIELTYSLTGVDVEWRSDPVGRLPAERLWMPHLSPEVSQALLAGSAEAERLAALLARPGTLTLSTQLDLWQMLRPAVQPGSVVDEPLPPERVTVVLESPAPFHVRRSGVAVSSTPAGRESKLHRITWVTTPVEGERQPLEVAITTGAGAPVLVASWFTADDPRPRPLAQRRFFVPWAPRTAESVPAARPVPAALAGGDWHRGKQVFESDKAQCAKCHAVRGKGGWIGPDLSNLVHRDYESVLRDISQPSFAINPEHLAYTVALDDGRTLVGRVQTRGDTVVVGDIQGVETVVPRTNVEAMTPTLVSIMPEGLPGVLGDEAMRDLLTYLLLPEPR
jgi:putative heme-binding domain-containing protein